MKTLLAFVLVFAANTFTAQATPQEDILGTWRFISMGGEKVEGEFYIQFQSNGTASTWPSPAGYDTTKDGVSVGRYEITATELMIAQGNGTKYILAGDTLTLNGPKGEKLIYQREKNPPALGATRQPGALALPSSLSLSEIEAIATGLDAKIGEYPNSIKNAEDLKFTYETWTHALAAAEQRSHLEQSDRLVALLAHLFRQGNNMDAPGSFQRAHAALALGLTTYPDSIPLNLEAAFFYVGAGPASVAKCEEACLRLRQLLKTEQNLDVEYTLAFAYMLEGRNKEALRQINHFLAIPPTQEWTPQKREQANAKLNRTKAGILNGTIQIINK